MWIKCLCLVAVAALIGCASGGSPGASAPRRAGYLTDEEITAANADVQTAYDAVARLRPNWLVAHGVTNSDGTAYASVYVDGQQLGGLSSLKNIPAYQVADIRYYDVTQAGARFGIRAGTGGVIEVRTRTR